MNIDNINYLGIGVGYRESFGSEIFDYRSDIDFLEVIADSYLFDENKKGLLTILQKCFPLIFHSLNLSLGYYGKPSSSYLNAYKKLIEQFKPAYISDHIAYTRHGKINFNALTPLPFTRASINAVVNNYETVVRYLRTPFILENISYDINFPWNHMSEVEFLCEIANKSECGFLLDLTNIYSNCINHDYDPFDFLKKFPLHRVVQLHFTGGHWNGEIYVDSHSTDTPEHVWRLFEKALQLGCRPKGIILERDEEDVKVSDIIDDARRARDLWKHYKI